MLSSRYSPGGSSLQYDESLLLQKFDIATGARTSCSALAACETIVMEYVIRGLTAARERDV